MKVHKLTEAEGGESFSGSKLKSAMFAHSSSAYWGVYLRLHTKKSPDFDLFGLMFAGVPIMHMALELILKASVIFYDPEYDPISDRHSTIKIINEHASNIPEFAQILTDDRAVALIKELEKGWLGLRYGECSFELESGDEEKFFEIMTQLRNEYSKITGLSLYA